MKRVLSLILAIIMVAAMLPGAAFAAEEGLTIRYDISGHAAELGAVWTAPAYYTPATVYFDELNYKLTDGFYKFAGAINGYVAVPGSVLTFTETNDDNSRVVQIANGRWIAFEVFVPKAGTYTMKMYNAVRDNGNDVYANVYVSKDTTKPVDANLVGSYLCTKTGADGFEVLTEPSIVPDINIEEAGYYIFTFMASGGDYASVGAFELVSGEGTGTALMSVDAEIENAGLNLTDRTTANTAVTCRLTDGSETTAYDSVIEYESSNPEVASVDANGKITAHAVGKATITAYVQDGQEYKVADSEIVTVDDAGIKVLYNINSDMARFGMHWISGTIANVDINTFNYVNTNGFYEFDSVNKGLKDSTDDDGNAIQIADNVNIKYAGNSKSGRFQLVGGQNTAGGIYAAFEINVPRSGVYTLTMDCVESTDQRTDTDLRAYISDAATTNDNYLIGTYNIYNAEAGTAAVTKTIGQKYFAEAGKYIITFYAPYQKYNNTVCYSFVDSFALSNGNESIVIGGNLAISDAALMEGETATATAAGYLSSTAGAAAFAYSSSDDDVATVDATGNITAVGAGTATITATCDDAVSDNVLSKKVVVAAPGADSVSLSAMSSVDGGKVTVNGNEYSGEVGTFERGTPMTVSAPDIEGYEFVGWKRGSEDIGKYIDEEQAFTFNLVTNTCLTAMYDKITDTDKRVEFWNENSTFIASMTETEFEKLGSLPKASLTGHTFKMWTVDGKNEFEAGAVLADAVTRAVAKYSANNTGAVVKVNGVAESDVTYGKEITATDDTATCWKRDGRIVKYGTSYTYYIWDATEITSSDEEIAEASPIVILDDYANGAYMIEYDAGDKVIVEAGIIFHESGKPTVDYCTEKYTSQRNVTHGQFTADGEGTARGYIIYEDGSEYKVIYAD